jgi:antitoxin HicB
MNVLSYRILLRQEPEGGYTVIVPSLPGCVTYGDTVEEAIEMAKEAIELYIESLKEHGEEIPTEEKNRTLAGAPSTDRGCLFYGRF